jgi:hypothetical protein
MCCNGLAWQAAPAERVGNWTQQTLSRQYWVSTSRRYWLSHLLLFTRFTYFLRVVTLATGAAM